MLDVFSCFLKVQYFIGAELKYRENCINVHLSRTDNMLMSRQRDRYYFKSRRLKRAV